MLLKYDFQGWLSSWAMTMVDDLTCSVGIVHWCRWDTAICLSCGLSWRESSACQPESRQHHIADTCGCDKSAFGHGANGCGLLLNKVYNGTCRAGLGLIGRCPAGGHCFCPRPLIHIHSPCRLYTSLILPEKKREITQLKSALSISLFKCLVICFVSHCNYFWVRHLLKIRIKQGSSLLSK